MIYVFSRDLTQRRMLLAVKSLTWTERYNGIGTFTLISRNTDDNAAMLRQGHIIHFNSFDGIIRAVTVRNDEIKANGYSLAQLLNQRTTYSNTTITQAESGAYALFEANRRDLDVVAGQSQGFTETCEVNVENGGFLGDWIKDICSQAGLGFRVVLDERSLTKTFEIYKGNDLTDPTDPNSVIFSNATNTLASLEIMDDGSEYANVAVVRLSDSEGGTSTTIIGDATGADRYEVAVMASGDESPTARGKQELQNRLMRTSFLVTVPATDYGVRYKLGDMVNCYSKKHGIKMTARVSEVTYTIDTQKETLDITLGEPKLQIRELVNLWQK